jgi:hypothetical protein
MVRPEKEQTMIKLDQVKVALCDQPVLNLLVEGCSNKKIAGPLDISLRTVKQHLRTLFLRAGIREGRKRVKLAIAIVQSGGSAVSDTPRAPHPEGNSDLGSGLGRSDRPRNWQDRWHRRTGD